MQGSAQRRRFDAFRLAASQGELAGRIDPADLPRLMERVAGPGGQVDWSIRGGADTSGRPAITVSIAGSVPLTCQRCLAPVSVAVGRATLLLLARDEAELCRIDEASEDEVVAAGVPLEADSLVEDELLLTLPFAPRHEDECATPAGVAKE